MFRTMLLASTLALGLTGAALAEGGPRLAGGGRDAQVTYDLPSANVVGGGAASIIGGGVNQHLAYGGKLTTGAPSGLVAEIVGGGADRQVVYHPAAPAPSSLMADRPAHIGS